MIEMATQTQTATDVVVHELRPLEELPVAICEHTLYVADGAIYAVLVDDALPLTAGDQIGLRRGELRRAWNAGDETARVVVATRHH
jgi:hypothetical protein